jgi:hypothetical protein
MARLGEHDDFAKISRQFLNGAPHLLDRLLLHHQCLQIETIVGAIMLHGLVLRGLIGAPRLRKPSVPGIPHNRKQPRSGIVAAQGREEP